MNVCMRVCVCVCVYKINYNLFITLRFFATRSKQDFFKCKNHKKIIINNNNFRFCNSTLEEIARDFA